MYLDEMSKNSLIILVNFNEVEFVFNYIEYYNFNETEFSLVYSMSIEISRFLFIEMKYRRKDPLEFLQIHT